MNLSGLVSIGGDGTLSIAQQLFDHGIPIVAVPKTIDNDLDGTLFTFGFDSAVACATDALDRLHTTAESHNRVMVLEVMGRYAGWIALAAGVAGGADVILIPEIPFRYECIAEKVREREMQGKNFTLIIVAEGCTGEGWRLCHLRRVQEANREARASAASAAAVARRRWRKKPARRRGPACLAISSAAGRRRRSIACSAQSSARTPSSCSPPAILEKWSRGRARK